MTADTPQHVVFIDSRVPDLQDLLAGLQPDEVAFVIDPSSDGIQQIANILAANNLANLATISFVGHGSAGAIDLGSTVLDDGDLSSHAGALSQIGAALSSGGTLQLYSCDTAFGTTGQQFIADLSSFIGGAAVAASSEEIGQTATGENWTLDAIAGPAASQSGSSAAPVQASNPFTAAAEANFSGTLVNPTTELWIAATAGGEANLILHADDTGTHVASNVGALFTPVSANNPSHGATLDGIDLLRFDVTNQKYFIATQDTVADELLVGSLSTALNSPTATPTYTVLYSNPNANSQGVAILDFEDDSASQQVFFIEGKTFFKSGYSSGSVTTLGTSSVFLNGLAVDLPHHVAYFVSSTSTTTTTTTLNGQPAPSNPNGHVHYHTVSTGSIYETSSLSASSSTNSVTISKLMDIPTNDGSPWTGIGVSGLAVDTTTGLIYFITQNVGTTKGGIFETNPNDPTHAITTLFREGAGGPTGNFTDLQIDHTTGLYYVSMVNTGGSGGAVFAGSLTGGTPTLFETIPTYTTGTTVVSTFSPAPEGFALDNAPTLTITPTNNTFTESTSNPASSHNTPVLAINSATAGDTDNSVLLGATVSVGSFFAGDVLAANTAGTSIAASYNSTTGTLTLTGLDSFSHYQSVLSSVTFTSTSDNPTDYGSDNSRALTWTVNDGLINSAPQTATVSVIGVNDPPTLTAAATASWTEKGGAKALSSLATVFDPDSLNLSNATISITGGTFSGDGDVLAAAGTTGTSITASYNSVTETLVLNGVDTLAHYQTVLDSVTFNSTSLNPDNFGTVANKSRTITWVLNDGSSSFSSSTVVTTTLGVTAVNDPPTLSATSGTVAFTEGQPGGATLSPSASVSDPDSLKLASATVQVSGGTFTGDGDVLSTSTIGTAITATYNSSTETLVLSGSDTLANYQTVLDRVSFSSGSNPDDYGSNKTRTVTWLLNDGGATSSSSTLSTTTISITAINDPPVISVAPTATYLENDPQTTLSGTASVSDVDSLTLSNATVKVVGGAFSGDGDDFRVNGVGNGGTIAVAAGHTVTIGYDSTSETLTLTGTDTVAHYQTLIEEVSFRSTSDNPTNFGANQTRTLTWVVNDGAGSNNLSSVSTTTISITAVNDPPTLTVAGSASFTENGASFALSPTVSVSDPDNTTWAGATVKIASGTFNGDGDILGFSTAGTSISASYDTASETLTLSGSDTLADYRQVLQSVTFFTASDNPTNYGSAPTRTITWTINDSASSINTTTVTETLSITAINDPPTLANVASSAAYTELGSVATLASAAAVVDPDSLTLASATVQVVSGSFTNDGDVFSVNGVSNGPIVQGSGTITVAYNAATETLTLSGADTLAHYQALLDEVEFSSTSHNPTDYGSNPTRTVTWLLNDGSGSSNLSTTVTTTVSLTAVNDAPTLAGTTNNVSFTENSLTPTTLSPSVTVSDPDNQVLAGATVAIVGGTFTNDGDVLATSTAGTSITASYNSSTETLTLSGSDTFANYQTVLDRITFTTPSDNPDDFGSAPTRTVSWVLNDGSSTSAAQTTTINITASNDAPTLSAVPSIITYSTGAVITLAAGAVVSDPDNLDLASATVSITAGAFTGDTLGFSTAGTSITATYDSVTQLLTLTGSDTLSNYQTVLDGITFTSSNGDPANGTSNPTRTLTWVVNDGTTTGATQTETITIQTGPAAVPQAHAAFTENQASPTTIGQSLVVSDPSSTNLLSATVSITGGKFAGDGDVVGLAGITAGTVLGMSFAYDSTSESLVFTGSDTLAHYQIALDNVTFTTPSDNPADFGSDPTRTVTWTVVDDTGTTNNTGTSTSTIDITAINDAPTATSDASVAFTEGNTTTISPSLTVTDVDSLSLTGATVSIDTGKFAGDGDVLAANTASTNITASYDSTSEVLTLSGSDSLAHYIQVLDSVTFQSGDNPDDFGSSTSRTVTWVVNDGGTTDSLSAPATTTINITAVNDAPTVTAATTDFFVTGQTLTLSPSLSVSDPDNINLASATVSVAGFFTPDGDVLGFDTSGTSINAVYDSVGEVLTLTGPDTLAHYQQVLDSVTFASGGNPTENGTAPTRTITWVTNDGSTTSTPQTTTVSLQLGPAIFVPDNAAFTENQTSPVILDSTIALSDSTPGAKLITATVALTGGTFSGDGDLLSATAPSSITVSYDSVNEVLTLTGTDTVANYQTYLESVTFTTPSDNPTNFGSDPSRTVTWTVVDNQSSNTIGTATSTIAITATNDAPSVTAVPSVAFTEGNTTAISPALSVSDVDSLNLAGATISITGGKFTGDGDVLSFSTAGTSITASYDSTNEVLVLSGSDTVGNYQTVLDSVKFSSGDNPDDFGAASAQTRTVTWVVDDGSGVSNLSNVATTTINVTAVNDPPTVSNQTTTVPFAVNTSVTLSPAITVSDPDSLTVASATVSITAGKFSGDGDVLTINGVTSGNLVNGGNAIAYSYDSVSEALVLTGVDTPADYASALDLVAFGSGANPNDFGSNPTRTISWVVDDGSGVNGASTPVTTTVSIDHIPPTLANVATTLPFTQGNTTAISPSLSVTDIDSQTLASATVQITGTFLGDGDVLGFNTSGTSITASYNAATETLTLTGSDSLLNYKSVLDSVTFRSGADPTNHGSNPTRFVTWVVNDGSASNGLSTAATTTISITPLDAAPTLTGVAVTKSFTEGGSSFTLSPALLISDPDSTTMHSATVHITGGTFALDGDTLGFDTSGTSITAAYDTASETLTLTGADTTANYKKVLDTVTFGTTSHNPTDYGSNPTPTVTWVVADDFNVHSAAATTTVSITAINDAPSLTSVTPTVAFLAGSNLQLAPTLSVADVDSLNIANATVQISGGFLGSGDQLTANVAGTHITAFYNGTTETMTLTGSDPVATYQAVLESITFSSGFNPTNFGSNLTRTVTWVVNDGSGSNNLSSVSTTTISITPINTPPALNNVPGNIGFTEGQTLTVAGSASVADPDNFNLANATVQIAGGTFAGDGDILAFSTAGTSITAAYNSSTETLTLTGADTLANYQQVLDSVTFGSGDNPDNFGSNTFRTVTWLLNDGSASNNLSTIQTTTIGITAVNDPPTLTGAANAAFTENGASVTLSPSVMVSDPDSLGLVSATVRIAGGTFTGDGDILGFNTAGTSIAASYDSTSETLTLTGSDSFAHYAQVLDSVTFVTPSHNPDDFGSAPTRTVTWVLNDGSPDSISTSTVTTTIGITAINDAPTLSSVATSATVTELGPAVTLSPNASVFDVDNVKLAGATVKVVGGTFASDGDRLAATAVGTITVNYNAATETLTLSGSDTLANYQQVLDSVTFASSLTQNPTNYGSNPTRTLTWVLNDGTTTSAAQTETVTIVAVNNAPTLSNVATNIGYTEQAAAVTLSGGLSLADPDNLTLVNATVKVAGGAFAGDGDVLAAVTTGTSITATYNSTTETLVLSGTDTVAHYQSVLDSVTFFDPSDNPTNYGSNTSRVITWTANDGSASNNIGVGTTTVSITAVNDAPTLTNVPALEVFHLGQTLTVASVAALADPDNLTLANATVKVTAGTFSGDGDVLAANVSGTSITASYNSTTETLTLTGSDTVAHYQQVLDSVTFSSGADPSNSGSNPSRVLSWTVNDGAGSNNTVTATTTLTISTLVKNDFDGNHVSDIIFQDTAAAPVVSGRNHIGGDANSGVPLIDFMSNGTVASSATLSSPSIAWHIVGSGDFNNDNKSDILWQSTDGTPMIWTLNGPSVTSQTTLTNPGASWHAVGTADFNGDNKSDILFQNSDGTPLIWLMNNTTISSTATLTDPGASWRLVGTGDFNNDGKSDLVFQNSDGTPMLWTMNGTSVTSQTTLTDPGSAWRLIGTGDFNNDGFSDLLFQNNDGTPQIWTMNGTSVASTTTLANPGSAFRAVGTGDYNGDGKSDILFQNQADGTPLVWTMNNTTVTAQNTLPLPPSPSMNWHANSG